MTGAEGRWRRPSSRTLRAEEAERLKSLTGQALSDALPPTTWLAGRSWAGLAFWGVGASAVWLCLLDIVAFAVGVTDQRHVVAPDNPSTGLAGWILLGFLSIFAPLMAWACLACWHRQSLRLDADGFTHCGVWAIRRSPKSYRWSLCEPFVVIDLPTTEYGAMGRLETVYEGKRFIPDFDDFGDAHDLCVILNTYRSEYTDGAAAPASDVQPTASPASSSSPAGLRSQEALHISGSTNVGAALVDSTWEPAMFRAYAELVMITLCALGFTGLFVWVAVSDGDAGFTVFAVLWLSLWAVAVTWAVYGVVNRRSVHLSPAGISIGGRRRFAWGAGPRFYRWGDCAEFVLHYIDGDPGRWVVRSKALGDRIQFEGEFGDPADLVVILNAYRSAYGAVELT